MLTIHDRRAVAVALLLALTLLTAAISVPAAPPAPPLNLKSQSPDGVGPAPETTADETAPGPSIAAYRGLASWVDMYDGDIYRHPVAAVQEMADREVRTLFIETANFHRPAPGRNAIYREGVVSTLVEAAHARGIRTVAWYLPSFENPDRDYRRSMAAIRFRTANGQRFDSFSLDIEYDAVRDLARRNRRLDVLSQRISQSVAPDYPLGAIVPEAGALYWVDFPYATVARHYDVVLPMAYFTFRTQGRGGAERFISANIDAIRDQAPGVPIHVIGGVSNDASAPEVRGFVDAAIATGVAGASLYAYGGTTDGHWRHLARITRD